MLKIASKIASKMFAYGLLSSFLVFGGCTVDNAVSRAQPIPFNETINQLGNPSNDNGAIPRVDTSTLLDRITVTYKPLAREQASEFSLDDISSPHLIEIAGVDFASEGTIFLGGVSLDLVRKDDGGGAYLGITNFSPSDYASFSSTNNNNNALLRLRFRTADGNYRVDMALARVSIIPPTMTAPSVVTAGASIDTTYKPFASGHNGKFSLGDFDSPYLVRLNDDTNFAAAQSMIFLNDVPYGVTETKYQGDTYVGIDGFGFGDYTTFINALLSSSATLTIKVNLRAADGTYIASNETIASGLTVTAATDIYTWQDLQGMEHDIGASYRLRSDITFPARGSEGLDAAGFEPVGDESKNRFTGSFNGDGHRITGLSIERGSRNNVGIWGYVDDGNSVIENFVVDHGGIRGGERVGSVVGELENGTVNNVRMVSGVSNDVSGTTYVGGLVGWNSGLVTNSSAEGAVSGNSSVAGVIGGLVGKNNGAGVDGSATGRVSGHTKVGGLVGENEGGRVNGSAAGEVSGTGGGNNDVGGLVGFNHGAGAVVTGSATGRVSGDTKVGGLVGENNDGRVNGYATGNVEGNAANVGGLVGENNDGRVNGYAAGDVNGNAAVGGLVGNNAINAEVNGYATGDVEGNINIGGLVGNNAGEVAGYATGTATGRNNTGGLVGLNFGTAVGYATGAVTRIGTAANPGGLVGYNNDGTAVGYWDEGSTGQADGIASSRPGSTFNGAGISAITNVVYASTAATYTDTKGTTATSDDVVVFDDTDFLDHFTLPGASATWPTLKAAP